MIDRELMGWRPLVGPYAQDAYNVRGFALTRTAPLCQAQNCCRRMTCRIPRDRQ